MPEGTFREPRLPPDFSSRLIDVVASLTTCQPFHVHTTEVGLRDFSVGT